MQYLLPEDDYETRVRLAAPRRSRSRFIILIIPIDVGKIVVKLFL